MRKKDYRWGLTHGDFHPGQIMYRDDIDDYVMLDWEFSGILGNPGIDLATWMSTTGPKVAEDWTTYLNFYWEALIDEGVEAEDYPLQKLKDDYLSYGTANVVVRYLGLISGIGVDPDVLRLLEWWFDRHNLIPE